MTDTIVVAGRHTPFQMDLTADLFIRGFNLYGLSWVTMNSAFRTLSLALANNPVTNVEFAATESTPKTTLVAKDNQSSEYAKMRSDVLGTFLRDAPTKDSTIGPALKEMAQKGVAWEITVQDAFTTEQKALITSQGGDPSRIRGFSTIPKGSDLQLGSVVKTVVLDNWADDKVQFGTMLGHEIGHLGRDANGVRLSESYLLSIENSLYNNIFVSGRTQNPDGASIDSSGTVGSVGNDLIYGTPGNNTIDAKSGNNTIVSYSGNDLMTAKYGADFFSIRGNGAKAIKDGGGVDTMHIPWIRSPDDLEYRLEFDGTLYLSLRSPDPSTEANRVAIFNWVDGYGTGAIEWLSYSDNYGNSPRLNFTLLARRELGLGDYLLEGLELTESSVPDSYDDRRYDNVIGTPVPGFEVAPIGDRVIAPLADGNELDWYKLRLLHGRVVMRPLIFYFLAAAAPLTPIAPEPQTPLLAALAVSKAVPGGRCLNQDMRAVKADDVIGALKDIPLDWSREDLAEARASLARGSSSGRSIGVQEAASLQRYGWSVFKFTGKRRRSCQLYVSVREPVIAGNYALTEVIYNPLPEDRGYVVPVLLQKYDYGWSILAVGAGYIVVI